MKIMILASGGDAPGMNSCIHYLTKFLKRHEVYACRYGYQGILEKKFEKITTKDTFLHRNIAGVFIKSARSEKFKTAEGIKEAIKILTNFGVDYLIVLGGDGSFRGAQELVKRGIKVVFIPSTIDRDMPYETYTMGFYTAVSACVNYINNVKPTMDAFDRTCIYEVMGRHDPDLAGLVGQIVKADMVIDQNNMNNIDYKKFKKMHNENPVRTIILQENTVPIEELVQSFSLFSGGEVRQCVIGYVQRGTAPTQLEKFHCKQFAKYAQKAINNKMIAFAIAIDDDSRVKTIPFNEISDC